MSTQDPGLHTRHWRRAEALAEGLIPTIGALHRDQGVVLNVHGRSLVHKSAIDILKAHRFARHTDERVLALAESTPIIAAVAQLKPRQVSVDVGQLAYDYYRHRAGGGKKTAAEFLRDDTDLLAAHAEGGARDIVLYGFGRIGRLVARLLIEHDSGARGSRLRAIVLRPGSAGDLRKRASLLRRDSVHGAFDGTISIDEDAQTITANGTVIQVIYASDPAEIDYTVFGIDRAIVIDNTGKWRDRDGLEQHLRAQGVDRVILTAPGKGDLQNVVFGINHHVITDDDRIVTAASCTTNAITPVLKVLHDEYGVVSGHVETVHSFTNDQNLTDNFHKGDRRGRAATLNMVLTATGAASAVAKALPELAGKLTGNAIRVPTPDVSLAVLNLQFDRDVTRTALNHHLRMASLASPLRRQIDYVESPEAVSTDMLGSRHAGVVDGLATIAPGGRSAVVYVWYDNEFGYSAQVVRLAEYIAGSNLRSVTVSVAAEPEVELTTA